MTMFRTIRYFFQSLFWIRLEPNRVPKWVIKQGNEYYDHCKVRPYNKTIYLNGNNYTYKIWFEMIGHGEIKEHFYRKRIARHWREVDVDGAPRWVMNAARRYVKKHPARADHGTKLFRGKRYLYEVQFGGVAHGQYDINKILVAKK